MKFLFIIWFIIVIILFIGSCTLSYDKYLKKAPYHDFFKGQIFLLVLLAFGIVFFGLFLLGIL